MHTTIQTILSLALALALGLSSQRSLAQEPAPPNVPAPPNAPAPPNYPLTSKLETKTIQLNEEAESIAAALFQVASRVGVTMTPTARSIILTGPPGGVLLIENHVQELDLERMGRIAEDIELGRIRMGMPPFDLEIGPTLGETLARIEAAFAAERFVLNVVVTDPELLKLRMVKTKLRAVGLVAVATLIPKLMVDQPAMSFRVEVADDSSRSQPQSSHAESRVIESLVMLIERTVFPNQSSIPAVRPAPQSSVYKIDGTQDTNPEFVKECEKSQDNILAAIDTGLEVIGRSPDFQIKLHRPTGTIFVKGSAEELRMVREVVELATLPNGSAVFFTDPQP